MSSPGELHVRANNTHDTILVEVKVDGLVVEALAIPSLQDAVKLCQALRKIARWYLLDGRGDAEHLTEGERMAILWTLDHPIPPDEEALE